MAGKAGVLPVFLFSAVVGVRKVQARFLFHTSSATALFDTNNRQLLRGVVGTQKIG
jgi:hypothetical protein